MDRGAWWVTVHEVTKSQATTEQLSMRAHMYTHTHRHTWLFCMVQIEMHIILHSSLQEEENEIKSRQLFIFAQVKKVHQSVFQPWPLIAAREAEISK